MHSSHRTGNDEDDRDDGDNDDDEDDGDDDVNEDDVIRCHMFLFPRFHSQRCTLLILAMCATKSLCEPGVILLNICKSNLSDDDDDDYDNGDDNGNDDGDCDDDDNDYGDADDDIDND